MLPLVRGTDDDHSFSRLTVTRFTFDSHSFLHPIINMLSKSFTTFALLVATASAQTSLVNVAAFNQARPTTVAERNLDARAACYTDSCLRGMFSPGGLRSLDQVLVLIYTLELKTTDKRYPTRCATRECSAYLRTTVTPATK